MNAIVGVFVLCHLLLYLSLRWMDARLLTTAVALALCKHQQATHRDARCPLERIRSCNPLTSLSSRESLRLAYHCLSRGYTAVHTSFEFCCGELPLPPAALPPPPCTHLSLKRIDEFTADPTAIDRFGAPPTYLECSPLCNIAFHMGARSAEFAAAFTPPACCTCCYRSIQYKQTAVSASVFATKAP